jgi:ribosome-associated protein
MDVAMADDEGLRIDATRSIPRDELVIRATRSGGPGGQHVNTSSTRVELEWRPQGSRILTDEERERIVAKLASRIDGEGVLRIVVSDTRSQARNRGLAEERLGAMVREALVVPKRRKATRPTQAARRARLEAKKRRSDTKARRRSRDWEQ